MNCICRIASAITFSLLVLVGTVSAEDAPQTLSLEITDGKLAGPGAEMMRAELSKAQFILFGEDHGFADSPIVLRAILQEARPLGFKYHVVEVGPLSTRMIREKLASQGLPGLREMVHEVPLGFPFLSLKNDAELASDFLGQDSKGTPFLWGVDQEFIGSSPLLLQQLVKIAPNEAARAAAERLLKEEKEAAAKAEQDKFLLTRFHDTDFTALAAEFKGTTEAEKIIAALQESAAVYQLWQTGRNYENNARRARLLAKNFLENYRAAAEAQPKVVFKMGAEHTALGTTTNNTMDLGTLATSIAHANGQTALRILFLPMGGHVSAFKMQPGDPTSVQVYADDDVKDFFTAIGLTAGSVSKEGWTLVPLEPVRQKLDTKGINALKRFPRFLLLGYDYVITTPDAQPGVSLY